MVHLVVVDQDITLAMPQEQDLEEIQINHLRVMMVLMDIGQAVAVVVPVVLAVLPIP
tara:strand:+ start:213 stop:383 length:171 start_codon:yes stop_codon:yes gene_type:complete